MHKINGFSIDEELYTGKSRVYRGSRNSDGKKVVIKMLDDLQPSQKDVVEFKTEFNILKNLQNVDGVIDAYLLDKSDGRYYFAMEDIGGVSLKEYLYKHKLDLLEKIKIAMKIWGYINNIHQKKILHKDINPSNIIINPENLELRIIDFGLASIMSREESGNQSYEKLEGSFEYISPEQTGRMNRLIDYRSDYYSFGISFYEILNGVVPFKSDDPIGYIHMHLANKIVWPEQENNVPPMIKKIVGKLLEKEKDKRYQSAGGLIYDLEKFVKLFQIDPNSAECEIGERDTLNKLEISPRLYGRDKELDSVKNALDLVLAGSSEITFLKGQPGVGKSAIVYELYPLFIEKGCYFVSTKSDQYNRDIFYSSLIEIFKDAFLQILMESDQKLRLWRNRIFEKVGSNGRVIIDIIPEFEKIIGKQPELQELPPTEAKNRFFETFYNLIGALATKDSPFVFFIDDLQWCDASTLTFIRIFLTTGKIPYAYLLCAYRDNDSETLHLLEPILNEIRANRFIHELEIEPLTNSDFKKMLSDSLNMKLADVEMLAQIIHTKTAGNPFYALELFKSLRDQKVFLYDVMKHHWSFDISVIESFDVSDNVVDYIVERLKRFSAIEQEIIGMAACLGSQLYLTELLEIVQQPIENLRAVLFNAIENDIIRPTKEFKLFFHKLDDIEGYEMEAGERIKLTFTHDRIQQAAYNLLTQDKIKLLHRDIARLLFRRQKNHKEDSLMRMVYHYNHCLGLIVDESEKTEIIYLNLQAVEKAKKAVAFENAYSYISKAIELVKNYGWKNHGELLKRCYMEFAVCAYLVGNYSEADRKMDELLTHLKAPDEKAEVYITKALQYSTVGKMEEAITNGFEGLKLLGVKIPRKPSYLDVLIEFLKIKKKLATKDIAALAEMKSIQDKKYISIMQLMSEMAPSAYLMGNEMLFGLLVLKLVNCSLKYGNYKESGYIYSMYAMLSNAVFNDYKSANEFGKLSIVMNDKFQDLKTASRIYHGYADFVLPWFTHWSNLTEYQEKGIEAGYLSGDYLFLSYIALHIHTWNPRLNIIELCELKQQQIQIIERTRYQDALDEINLFYAMLMNLRGLTESELSLNYDNFDEAECLERMKENRFSTGVTVYYIWKAEICCIYNEYQKADDYIQKAEKTLSSVMGLPYIIRFTFIKFISKSNLIYKRSDIAINELKKVHRQMRKWAVLNPTSFYHLELMMKAEIIRIKDSAAEAMDVYDLAIQKASENGWLRDEAFFNSLIMSHLYRDKKYSLAKGYFDNARYLFEYWGASRKVSQLDRDYNEMELFGKKFIDQSRVGEFNVTISDSVESHKLDIAAILKSAAIISDEIELDSLLKKIMNVAVEIAGAERGCFISNQNDELTVLVEKESDRDAVVLNKRRVSDYEGASSSIIYYVARMLEDIVYFDATKENKKDEYINEHQTKSIICIPFVRNNSLKSILYLENNFTRGVFTQDRIAILKALLAQMDISFENALLYQSLKMQNNKLEEQVEMRTKELRELNILLSQKNEKLLETQSELVIMAKHDPLTNLLNRRSMSEILEVEALKYKTDSKSFCLLLLDVDNFKMINDSYGHDCGDYVLKRIAEIMISQVRKSEAVSRWGGEEFLILAPDTDSKSGYKLAERIRMTIANQGFEYGKLKLNLSVTIGIGVFDDKGLNIEQVIKFADNALYAGKNSGKNKVVLLNE